MAIYVICVHLLHSIAVGEALRSRFVRGCVPSNERNIPLFDSFIGWRHRGHADLAGQAEEGLAALRTGESLLHKKVVALLGAPPRQHARTRQELAEQEGRPTLEATSEHSRVVTQPIDVVVDGHLEPAAADQ